MHRILVAVAIACFAFPAPRPRAQPYDVPVGIQTWTLRRLTFEQAVGFAVRNKIKYVQMYGAHLDPKAPPEESRRKKKILDENGLVLYAFGVAETTLDKGENRKLFEFAKLMGVKLIIVEPPEFEVFDNLEELVKEYDIRIAVHNHGGESLYGNPAVLRNLLKRRDPRIGVCLDAGWVTGAGFDAEDVFRRWGGRVFDIHLKDVRVSCAGNRTAITNVPVGAGDANLKGLLRALKDLRYAGVLAVETDADLKDATEFVTGAVRFVEANKP
jgi:sugar phosphate isomerase/epimerase